jgi:hypothetical protein
VKLPDQVEREVLGAALAPDGTQAVVQRTDVAQRHGGIVGKPLVGSRGLVFEELGQVGPGTLDLAAEHCLSALQAAGDEVGMGSSLATAAVLAIARSAATNRSRIGRAFSVRGQGGGTSALTFSRPGTGTRSLRRSGERSAARTRNLEKRHSALSHYP